MLEPTQAEADSLLEDEVQHLVDHYVQWLRDKTTLRRVNGGWVEITTPHLDRHNDYLQIHVRREDGHFLLSDQGYILEDLEDSGCRLDEGRRRQLLDATLRGFGIELADDKLVVRACNDDFAVRTNSRAAGSRSRAVGTCSPAVLPVVRPTGAVSAPVRRISDPFRGVSDPFRRISALVRRISDPFRRISNPRVPFRAPAESPVRGRRKAPASTTPESRSVKTPHALSP